MVTTIQQTSKRYKLMILIGCIIIFLGLLSFIYVENTAFIGISLALGIGFVAIGKFLKWWHHE